MVEATHRASTVERILDAAEACFAERGYAGTSISEVCSRSGLPVGSIYHHFGNKEGLLVAVVDRGGEAIARELADAESEPNIPAYFERAGKALWRQMPAMRINVMLGLIDLPESMSEKLAERRRAAVETIASVLQVHCERAGADNAEQLARDLAGLTLALSLGAVAQEKLEPGRYFETLRYAARVVESAVAAAARK
jgi:AcrR family transcriptional regulator